MNERHIQKMYIRIVRINERERERERERENVQWARLDWAKSINFSTTKEPGLAIIVARSMDLG